MGDDWLDCVVGEVVVFEVVGDAVWGWTPPNRPAVRPCAVSALTTVSHPRSSVLIRSLSSSFSLSLARSLSARMCSVKQSRGLRSKPTMFNSG